MLNLFSVKLVQSPTVFVHKLKIIEPIPFSDWAAPIVPVMKQDKSIRICGDFKLTVNKVAKLDCYPLPRMEDLFSNLSSGTTFTKLDLSQAYQQLELDEQSKQYSHQYSILSVLRATSVLYTSKPYFL